MKAKKLLAGVLTCTMVFAMGMTAFAADGKPIIYKHYVLENDNTTSPAEMFNFKAEFRSVSEAAENVTGPELTIASALYAEGENEKKELAISHKDPFPSVGIYTYIVKETNNGTAGVAYDDTEKTLKVTVTNATDGEEGFVESYAFFNTDGTKSDTVVNTYKAGSLRVQKKVTGNLGDKNKKFEVTVKFKTDKTVNSTISYEQDKNIKSTDWKEGEATAVVEIKNGQTVTFSNIPYGVTYEVVEANYKDAGYDAPEYKYDDINKKIDSTSEGVLITNNKNQGVDTGINLTTLPYMLTIAAIFVIAAIAFVAKRRRFED